MLRDRGSETLTQRLLRSGTYVVSKSPPPSLALQSSAFDTFFLVPHIGRVILPHFIPPNPERENGGGVCNGSIRQVFPNRNASACGNGR